MWSVPYFSLNYSKVLRFGFHFKLFQSLTVWIPFQIIPKSYGLDSILNYSKVLRFGFHFKLFQSLTVWIPFQIIRLQRIQRLTAKLTVYLQRSVYLYRGHGQGLLDLLEKVRAEMEEGDDLRIYNMSHVRDMWFLSHEKSVVQEVGQPQGIAPTWWQRLLGLVWRWK